MFTNTIGDNFTGAAIIPIIVLIDIIVIFATVFMILKLKNKLGICICWIPSFISLIIWIVLLCVDEQTIGLVILFGVFLPYFVSYTLTAILKLRSDKLKTKQSRTN